MWYILSLYSILHTWGYEWSCTCAITKQSVILQPTGSQCRTHTNTSTSFTLSGTQRSTSAVKIFGIERMVQKYFLQALAPSTYSSYHSAHLRFCTSLNLSPLLLFNPIYVSLSDSSWQKVWCTHRSMKSYLSALRYFQIELLGTNPNINRMLILSCYGGFCLVKQAVEA